MADLDSILSQLPIGDIAAKLGVDEQTAADAISQAAPALLGGMQHNAQTPEGQAALGKALAKHAGEKTVQSVDDIDTEDGEKIVNHVFGDNAGGVGTQLSKAVGGIDFGKLLPMIAPIVMNLLANKTQSATTSKKKDDDEGGFDLGGLIGGLLGGNGSGSKSGGGFDIGGLLGGLFGGKK